jgi:hypothetical protein
MKNKLKGVMPAVAIAGLAVANTASAAIEATAATGAISSATTLAETVAVAGFAVAGVFLTVRLIKRAIRSAG